MFGGAQSALCRQDNRGADVSRRGLALSPAAVSLPWTLLQD